MFYSQIFSNSSQEILQTNPFRVHLSNPSAQAREWSLRNNTPVTLGATNKKCSLTRILALLYQSFSSASVISLNNFHKITGLAGTLTTKPDLKSCLQKTLYTNKKTQVIIDKTHQLPSSTV